MAKKRDSDYQSIRRGGGFHGYEVAPIASDVDGAASALTYLVRLEQTLVEAMTSFA